MRKIQKLNSGRIPQVPQKICIFLLFFFLNCQKCMTTLIYQCKNCLRPILETPLYIQKFQINRSENEGIFFPFSQCPKYVADNRVFRFRLMLLQLLFSLH